MGLKTRKAAEVAEKRRVNAEMEARKHLLVKMGAERNVREAYLSGVVFAGLANDEEAPEIQSEEREILNGICESLDLDRSLIDAIITTEKSSIDDNTYMDLLCECLGLLTDIKMLDSFLEDFDRIWSAGKGNLSELKSWHNDFEEMVSADVAKALAERKSVEAKKAKEEKQRQAEAKRAAEQRQGLILSYSQNVAKICADHYFYRIEYIDRDDIFKLRTDLEEMGYVKSMASVLLSEVEKHLEVEGTGSALINAAWGLMGVMSLVKTYYYEEELRTLSEVLRRTMVATHYNQDDILSFGRCWLFQVMKPYCEE